MTRTAFDHLLTEARHAHDHHPDLRAFCGFPDDLRATPATPFHVPAAEIMAGDHALSATGLTTFRDAFIAAGPDATWRETYKGSGLPDDFMDRFGCYCLVGKGGNWISTQMACYLVYMPAGLYYPWHQHPAEELYLVVAGEARFYRDGMGAETLGPGQTAFHKSDQPHAMQTLDKPVMAYVVWRNNLGILPVLTDDPAVAVS